MDITDQTERASAWLGFGSAALVTFLTALFFVSLVIPSQNLMYASSFQSTFIQNNSLPFSEEALKLFVFIPGTPIFAQDMVGSVFRCAVLFLLPTIVIPAISLPVNEAGTGIGNKVSAHANMVCSAYFTVTAAMVTLMFKRMLNPAPLTQHEKRYPLRPF